LGGNAEIEAYGLGMADMKVAIGFRGKPGRHPPVEPFGSIVFIDDIPNKVRWGGNIRWGHIRILFSLPMVVLFVKKLPESSTYFVFIFCLH
jgi:hypothetical protein